MSAKINIAKGPASIMMEGTADAMDNIWDAYVDWPWGGDDTDAMEFSYRCQGFTPPQNPTKTYGVVWHGVEAQMIAAGSGMTRKFKLTYRLDATWNLYNKFVTWKKITNDSNTSGVANKAAALGNLFFAVPNTEYVSTSFPQPTTKAPSGTSIMIGGGKDGDGKILQQPKNCIVFGFADVQVVDVTPIKFQQSKDGKAPSFDVEIVFGDYADSFNDQIKDS